MHDSYWKIHLTALLCCSPPLLGYLQDDAVVETKRPTERPNVIVILADDLGCGDMSLYDGWIKTPRIDRMAAQGVKFTDFHSNCSVCSPTRHLELHPTCGESVQVGSRDLRSGVVAGEIPVAQVVRQDEDDVGWPGGVRLLSLVLSRSLVGKARQQNDGGDWRRPPDLIPDSPDAIHVWYVC